MSAPDVADLSADLSVKQIVAAWQLRQLRGETGLRATELATLLRTPGDDPPELRAMLAPARQLQRDLQGHHTRLMTATPETLEGALSQAVADIARRSWQQSGWSLTSPQVPAHLNPDELGPAALIAVAARLAAAWATQAARLHGAQAAGVATQPELLSMWLILSPSGPAETTCDLIGTMLEPDWPAVTLRGLFSYRDILPALRRLPLTLEQWHLQALIRCQHRPPKLASLTLLSPQVPPGPDQARARELAARLAALAPGDHGGAWAALRDLGALQRTPLDWPERPVTGPGEALPLPDVLAGILGSLRLPPPGDPQPQDDGTQALGVQLTQLFILSLLPTRAAWALSEEDRAQLGPLADLSARLLTPEASRLAPLGALRRLSRLHERWPALTAPQETGGT